MRVATFFQNQASLTQLQKSNEELAKLTYQITTGNKTSRLAELAGSSDELLNLKDVTRNADIYIKNIDTARSRLSATESALQGLTSLLTDAASVSTLGRNENSAEARASLAPKVEALTRSFYSLFNTKFDGRYIFSGNNGAEPPTTATATSTTFPGSPAPSTYYTGDTAKT